MNDVPSTSVIQVMKEIWTATSASRFVAGLFPGTANERNADALYVMMLGLEVGLPAAMALRAIRLDAGQACISPRTALYILVKAGFEVVMPDPATLDAESVVKIRRPSSAEYRSYKCPIADDKETAIWAAVASAARLEAVDYLGGLHIVMPAVNPSAPAVQAHSNGDPASTSSEDDADEDKAREDSGPKPWPQTEAWGIFKDWLHKLGLSVDDARVLAGLEPNESWAARYPTAKEACVVIDERRKQPATPKKAWVPEVIETAKHVYQLDPESMLKILGKKSFNDFPDKAAAENTMHRTAVERQLPVVSDRVTYSNYGKNGKAIEFETPGIILRLPGGREAIVQKLGDDGKVFYDENGLTVWETGQQYDIDPVKIVWSKNQKGVITIESITLVTPYAAYDEQATDDKPIDLAKEFPREPVKA
jgi:hypothetical protein